MLKMVDIELLENIYNEHQREILAILTLLLSILVLRFVPLPALPQRLRKMPAASPQTVGYQYLTSSVDN